VTATSRAAASGTGRRRTAVEGADRRRAALAWSVVAVALLAVGVTYARLRWPGLVPTGSDIDEYQLMGRALASFEAPLVAGVEGTKYPLGYPLVLAVIEWLRLPVQATAIGLNLAALASATGSVAYVAGRPAPGHAASPGAALAAGGVVVASVAVWSDVYSLMPELLLLAVVGLLLVTVAEPLHTERLTALIGLALAAVLLKTLALLLVVGGCVGVWLAAGRRPALAAPERGTRIRVLVPAAAATFVTALGMLAMRALPPHTTGYLATFFLVDPDDASLGRITWRGLVRRTIEDVPDSVRDLGRAVALIDADTALAVIVAVIALTVGMIGAWQLRRQAPLGAFVTGMTLAYVAGLAAWPYHSSRFGLPLVPVAALGAGWVVRTVAPRMVASLVVGVGVLAVLLATSVGPLGDRQQQAADEFAVRHRALDQLEGWAAEALDGQQVVSFDYREVARRLDRDVEPVAYTSDPDALWEQVQGADVLVTMDFYAKRTRQVRVLLETYPDRFEPLLETPEVSAYRVVR